MDDNEFLKSCDKPLDLEWDIAEIKRLTCLRRRKQFKRSVAERYRAELVALYNEGGLSFAQLALWLQRRKKIIISRSALHRKMREWPELNIRREGRGRNG